MNDLLLSELQSEQKSLLSSLALIEEHIFARVPRYSESINEVTSACREAIEGIDDSMAKAECLINQLYVGELFLDNERPLWPVISHQIESALDYKIMAPVIKAAAILHVATACELDAELVYVPENIMIRIICDDVYSVIFNPVTGESLNGQELDSRLDELPSELGEPYLVPMEMQSVVVEHLTALKNSLINELMFDKALTCVDLLLALRPDDPFERRDRGFLLHQLDCFKVAYDDYQFFVKECPKDPAAQLLKLQLDQITLTETVLH